MQKRKDIINVKKKIVCILMTCIMITVLVNVICASEDKDDKTIGVEIDCNGKIIGFLSFDREIEKINLLYPFKNIKEIEEDILNDKNVMLDYNSSVDKVEFTKMNYVLYCDSVLDKQKYIVPHYEMIDDKNNVVAVLPAIEDKYIKVK